MRIGGVVLVLISLSAWGRPKVLARTSVEVGARHFVLEIESSPSRPNAKGQGPCGAGQEVTLVVLSGDHKRKLFTKRIESCLTEVELAADRGDDDAAFYSGLLKPEDGVLTLHWLFVGERKNVVGHVNLNGALVQYTE